MSGELNDETLVPNDEIRSSNDETGNPNDEIGTSGASRCSSSNQ